MIGFVFSPKMTELKRKAEETEENAITKVQKKRVFPKSEKRQLLFLMLCFKHAKPKEEEKHIEDWRIARPPLDLVHIIYRSANPELLESIRNFDIMSWRAKMHFFCIFCNHQEMTIESRHFSCDKCFNKFKVLE
jgi:hypothetical protein